MALHNNDSVTSDSSAQSAPAGVLGSNRAQVAQDALRFSSNQTGGGLINLRPMDKNPGSDSLNKLQLKMKELLAASANSKYDYHMIPLEAGHRGIYYSSLIVAMSSKDRLKNVVAYHTLIIESSAERPTPVLTPINGINVEQHRTPSDVYDAKFAEVCFDACKAAFPNATIISASATVVPFSFTLEDQNRIHRITVNALLADHNELAIREPGFVDINLHTAGQDSTLRFAQKFDTQPFEDAVGNPVRSDVAIQFFSQSSKPTPGASLNSGDRNELVSEARGFIDLLYAPAIAPTNAFMPVANMGNNPAAFIKYAARLVLTNIESARVNTLSMTLLTILGAMTLKDGNAWYTSFFTRGGAVGKGRIDKRDPGGIGYEVNVAPGKLQDGVKIDTKTAAWQPHDLGQLLGLTVQQGLMISVDVADAGPETWYTDVFVGAAQSSSNAIKSIIDAANSLTNGSFSRYFQQNSSIFTDSGIRVHLGTYVDEDGQKRDLRDYDYLAILNLAGAKDISVLHDWSNSFNPSTGSLAERLHKRKKVLTGLNNTVDITGYATRVTFTVEFLEALARGAAEAGFNAQLQTPLPAGAFTNVRSVANGIDRALMGNSQSSFVRNGATFSGSQGGAGMTRWS